MRPLMWVGAVLGALLIGGVPAVAFTLAANDHPAGSTPAAAVGDRTERADRPDKPGNGPPSHANSRHNRVDGEKPGKQAKPEKHNHPFADGAPGAPGAHGRAHAAAMKEWASCVAEKAPAHDDAEGEFEPEAACGEKPLPPGKQKKQP